jgi:amidase
MAAAKRRSSSSVAKSSEDLADHSLSMVELQARLVRGETSSVALVESYMARIAAIDSSGPRINSVIECNPDAEKLAARLDSERKAGKLRGPLHGIPILVKDNIDTGDRMQTTAGSLAMIGKPAPTDAFIVQQLRAAGGLILGKTNLSEWANFRGRPSISGWSSRGGLTRNPYRLTRSASGSSSGSGAAVAADLCAAAVGTETDGSIISPAQTCGIVGLKPTVGLLSRSGIIPISHTQDTAGPMTRTVADAALLLAAMQGLDRKDAASRSLPGNTIDMYALDRSALRGARIGVVRDLSGTREKVLSVFEKNLAILRDCGAELIDDVALGKTARCGDTEYVVLRYEFKAGLDKYLRERGPSRPMESLKDIIAFNEAHRDQVLQYFGHEVLVESLKSKGMRTEEYLNAFAKNRRLTQTAIDRAMKKHRLHALVMPSGGAAWVIDTVNGDGYNSDVESTTAPAIAGYPHITVPGGFIDGLPVGLSFIAGAWQEATLLNLAYAFEQVTHHRQAPTFQLAEPTVL